MEVPVLSHEGERSCNLGIRISLLIISANLLLDFGNVLIVWYYFFSILLMKNHIINGKRYLYILWKLIPSNTNIGSYPLFPETQPKEHNFRKNIKPIDFPFGIFKLLFISR